MKILMFGWEFPPHISGGLGTACFGLTRALSEIENNKIIFVVPKSYGDEDKSIVNLIGASEVEVELKMFENLKQNIKYLEVDSNIMPYVNPKDIYLKEKEKSDRIKLLHTDHMGRIEFTGKYGPNLYEEIFNYSIVARTIADKHDFDIIHAHDWLTYSAGIEAKKISGKPLVIHVHATDFDRSGGSVNPRVFEIEQNGMQAADHIIAVSNLTRNTVIQKYDIPTEKVTTVYNAVEPLKVIEEIKAKRGVSEKIVTFLGRITLQKGPEYFIEAASKVLEKTDNVRFVMAGSGDMMDKMIKRVAELKISEKFHFTGFLRGDDVFKMLDYSDVYVMPSLSEPFGISPLEAMQSNVPVIISKQSGVSEILKHAVKVDFWDIDAMANAILGLISYEGMSKEFKKMGKEEVENLKWDNSAQNVMNVYHKVLKH